LPSNEKLIGDILINRQNAEHFFATPSFLELFLYSATWREKKMLRKKEMGREMEVRREM
jgi:hypothetical protein